MVPKARGSSRTVHNPAGAERRVHIDAAGPAAYLLLGEDRSAC
jgi:hypothetical protein